MVIFLYNLYIFVWLQHGCLANRVFTNFILDPNNSADTVWQIKNSFIQSNEMLQSHIFNQKYKKKQQSFEKMNPILSLVLIWAWVKIQQYVVKLLYVYVLYLVPCFLWQFVLAAIHVVCWAYLGLYVVKFHLHQLAYSV